jgi:hypothetical protein
LVKRIEGGSATDHALKNTARVDSVSIQCSATRDTGWESFVSARRIAVCRLPDALSLRA